MSDIDRLIAAVEAGDADFLASDGWIEAWDEVAPSLQTYRMKSDGESASIVSYAAYSGSLDAAHRLHEALLPGWAWSVECANAAEIWPKGGLTAATRAYSDEGNPARAWLLSILRAVKAQEGK